MTDIVERLRHPAHYDIDLNEAADEIERLRQEAKLWECRTKEAADIIEGNVEVIDRLRAEIKRLQAVLRNIAEIYQQAIAD